MNEYPHVTAQYSPVIYLCVELSVKHHIESGEIILTQSVLLFLVPLIPPCFHCTDSQQPFFQPASLTSVLAESILEHLVRHSQRSVLGFAKVY